MKAHAKRLADQQETLRMQWAAAERVARDAALAKFAAAEQHPSPVAPPRPSSSKLRPLDSNLASPAASGAKAAPPAAVTATDADTAASPAATAAAKAPREPKPEDFLEWARRHHATRRAAEEAHETLPTFQGEGLAPAVMLPPEWVVCEDFLGIPHPDSPRRFARMALASARPASSPRRPASSA